MSARPEPVDHKQDCVTPDEITGYVSGALSRAARRQVETHLKECETCRQLVDAHADDDALATEIREAYDADTVVIPASGSEHAQDTPFFFPGPIDGYEIRDEIHRGGQGVVFEAYQKATKRTVALKVLLHGAFASDRQRRRFEREIETVAGLQHPNIVTIYDSGVMSDGRPFYAMEYVDGVPLGQYVASERERFAEQTQDRARSLPRHERPRLLQESLRLFAKVCTAISYAHQHGVIHRDLKPSNILIDREGEPHVVDFGLAKAAEVGVPDGHTPVTLVGEFMGTIAYATPEQVKGNRQVDVRSDVYSLGVILYELLTGHFPYRVTGPLGEVFNQITDAEPEPPSAWARRDERNATPSGPRALFKIDNELETIVLKCLQKDADRRYQTVAELARDIERYLAGEPIEAKRDSRWYVLRKTFHRYWVETLVAAAVVVLVAEATFVSVVQYYQALDDQERVRHAEAFARQRAADEIEARQRAEGAIDSFEEAAENHREAGEYPQAEALLRQVLEVKTRTFGPDDWQTLECQRNLATLLKEAGRCDEAIALLQSVYNTLRTGRGPSHYRTLEICQTLGETCAACGRPNEAAVWRERLYASQPTTAPDEEDSEPAREVRNGRRATPDEGERG